MSLSTLNMYDFSLKYTNFAGHPPSPPGGVYIPLLVYLSPFEPMDLKYLSPMVMPPFATILAEVSARFFADFIQINAHSSVTWDLGVYLFVQLCSWVHTGYLLK